MNYSPNDIMTMKYHIAQRRIDQYMKYKKEKAEAMKNIIKKTGKGRTNK